MARIETDPNYTSPTFSRATAASDPFKKEDVQQVAAAFSVHDHSSGKGLAIATPLGGDLTGTVSNGGVLLRNNAGAISGLQVGGTPQSLLRIAADNSTQLFGATYSFLNVAGSSTYATLSSTGISVAGSVVATGGVSAASLQSNGGYAYLVNTTNYILGASDSMYLRPHSGNVSVQKDDGTWGVISAGSASLTGSISAAAGIGAMGATPDRAFVCPNVASQTGQGLAWQWAVYSSRDFKTDIVPLEDPIAIVLNDALHGVSYNHVGPSGPSPEATVVQTPSIGFVADDWLLIVPEVVSVDEQGKPIGMDYNRVEAITFEALKLYIQQTDARLAALEGA